MFHLYQWTDRYPAYSETKKFFLYKSGALETIPY